MPLQAILFLYYPNYHLHVTQKSWLILAKQKSLQDPLVLIQALLILGPLLYHVLHRYSIVDFSKFRGGIVAQEGPDETCNCSDKSSKCSIHTSPKLPDTDITIGLSSDEVSTRRNHGLNEIRLGHHWGLWALHFSSNPSQILILTGAILSLTLCEWRQVGLVCLLWLLTFTVPGYQTWSAVKVSESLCPDTSWPTITLRDGKLQEVSIKDLVPGDIVHASKGLMIPADGFMATCNDLLGIDESRIFGGATPMWNCKEEMCYLGTGVVLGEAFLQIERTGLRTLLGSHIQEADGSAKNHKSLFSSSEYLNVVRSIGVILLVVLVLPGLLWQTSASLIKPWVEIISITADMAIIAGRFFSRVAITSTRTIIAAKVSETGCIAQNIKAIEALAGIDTICVDNSGIITENRYILLKPYCVSCDPEAIILAASLSIAQTNRYNTLYRALSRALRQFPQAKARRDKYRIIGRQDMDYDNGRFYTQCIAEEENGTKHFFASGHPYFIQELFQKSAPADHQDCGKALKQAVKMFRKQGLGSLGLAQRKEGGNWELLGALPFFEPPRQSTALALRLAAGLGVRIKVLSSWNEALVEKSARVAGIEGSLLRAEMIDDFQQQRNDDDELAKRIIEADVYTELNARHREMILAILQDNGHRVAITGSVASHIPALRKADLGISIAATEEVLSASEVALSETTHGLLPLIAAIRSSRQGYQRLHNHVVRQTVRTLHVLLTMLFVFLVEGKLLDLRLLLMSTNFVEVLESWLGPKTPFQNKPSRWNRAQVLYKVFSLVVVMISGTYICAYSVPSVERLQLLSFLLTNGDAWIASLMQLDSCSRNTLRGLGSQLAAHLLITALCVTGWVGESLSVSMKTAFHVWLYGLGTFVTFGAVNVLPGIVKAQPL